MAFSLHLAVLRAAPVAAEAGDPWAMKALAGNYRAEGRPQAEWEPWYERAVFHPDFYHDVSLRKLRFILAGLALDAGREDYALEIVLPYWPKGFPDSAGEVDGRLVGVLRRRAEEGDVDAMFSMRWHDFDTYWRRRAAEGGHVEAMFELAEDLQRHKKKPVPEAVQWYSRAAAAGHEEAQKKVTALKAQLAEQVAETESLNEALQQSLGE